MTTTTILCPNCFKGDVPMDVEVGQVTKCQDIQCGQAFVKKGDRSVMWAP